MSITAIEFFAAFLAFKQYKMKQREQEMRNFESYVASLEQINQDMRRFKHDYINILSSLRTFIDDRNYVGLHKYFYDHILEANHHEQLNQQAMMILNNLKINSLKGLLTTKILQAQSHQVPFHIEVTEEITEIAAGFLYYLVDDIKNKVFPAEDTQADYLKDFLEYSKDLNLFPNLNLNNVDEIMSKSDKSGNLLTFTIKYKSVK